MEFKKSVVILGTRYRIIRQAYNIHEDLLGYTNSATKIICITLHETMPGWKDKSSKEIDIEEKTTLRHEIFHAFLNESGLQCCANQYRGSWSRNEEMIDFLAIQSPKIFKVFQELDIL